MQHRFRPGYLAYPAFFLALALAFGARAQTAPAPAPDAQQPAQPITELPQQTPQERARILREAQARVQTRRRIRQQQIIEDTYSHKFEVYGGGGYVRFRPGPSIQHLNEEAWNVGVTEWIRPKLGITGDFRGYYGTANTIGNPYVVFRPAISEYTFLGGPQYRFIEGQHFGWSAQVLAGVGHGNFSTGTGGFTAQEVGLYPDGNVFNVSVGAVMDYNLSPTLAVRLMPNYLLSDYGSELQHNLGFTSAIVYRFGRR